ncbi:hypothetical protein Pfo_005088 [Paulownia fortunei]|nr:hypothetical protein Pfo_005088 [Paulownia fortunei]
MASETVLSDHSTAPEEVDKEVQSEVKKMEPEHVFAPKESAEMSKPEESSCPAAPGAEAEPKIEEKQYEPPVAEEVKEISADENPKAEDLTEAAAPLAESTEQKIEDKPVEIAPSEEEKKTEDAPILEGSDKDIPEVAKETVPEPETTRLLEATVADSESKSEAEPAEKQESKVESIEEPAERVDVPGSSSAEVVQEKVEKAEELPAKEVEPTEVKNVTVSETKCKGEESSESTPVVEEKPLEQSEVTEQIEKEPPAAEPIEKVVVETPTDTAKDTKLPKEDKVAIEETVAIESSQVKSVSPKTQVEKKDVECTTTDEVSEKTGEANEEEEPAKQTVEVEALSEERIVEPGKIEEKTEIPEAKTEEKSVVAEELAPCEEKPIQDVTSSIPPPEITEKAAEEEVTSRDINMVEDNGNKKDETVASAETPNDLEVEGKVDKETTKETEQKIEETVQATAAKCEEEKQVDEAAKTDDIQNSKDSEDIKTKDVPVKTQKQSNNILKMVKQSLVKAKKAIIGKSQNPKTPASEPKDDTNK